MGTTQERQTNTLANYFPSGFAFGSKSVPGSVSRLFLGGLADELVRACDLIQEFRDEIVPDETILLIDEWEKAVKIPDGCFPGSGTITERRTHVLLKLASLGLQTADDFTTLAAVLGIPIKVVAGSVHGAFPYKFPIVFLGDPRAARHTIIVDADTDLTETFTYTFPITFEDSAPVLLQCLFDRLKPANVKVRFINLP